MCVMPAASCRVTSVSFCRHDVPGHYAPTYLRRATSSTFLAPFLDHSCSFPDALRYPFYSNNTQSCFDQCNVCLGTISWMGRCVGRQWTDKAYRGLQEVVTKDEKIMGGVPIPRSAFLRFTDEMHCQLYFPYPGDQVPPLHIFVTFFNPKYCHLHQFLI